MAAQPGPIASEVELRAQDERIEAIYREHAAGLRGRLIAITRDPAAADDLVGEAFLRLVTQVRDGRIPDDPGAWLHRVAGNLAISRGRRATVATRALPALLDRGLAESPEDEVVRRERNEVVRDALSTLDRDDQELVAMAAIGHRPVDIAGKTGRSNQATRTRLCRARGRLRARLIATGLMAWSGTPPLPTAAGVTPAASPCLSSPDVDEGRRERLIARSGELQRLTVAWDRAVSGRSDAVIVAGEAGIWKSMLVRAFAEGIDATGARVLDGGCVPLETGDLPYGPFVEALRGMLRDLDPGAVAAVLGPNRMELGRLIPELRPRPGTGQDEGAATAQRSIEGPSAADERYTQARLFEIVLGVVDRLARTAPTALIVEDLQWADPSTLDLLSFLVRNLHEERCLVVVTVRSDELAGRPTVMAHLPELERLEIVERIDLDRLDRDELGLLLADETGGPVESDVLDRVWKRTGGNPFFAEQLVAAETEGSADGDGTLPPRLRDVVLARVATVSEAGQEVLRVASAAGARIDDGLLADVTDLSAATLRQALREVTGRRILDQSGDRSDPYLVFHHALLREVIHDDLLPAERARLHARFATVLEARRGGARSGAGKVGGAPSASPAELAYHWDAAGDDRRALGATIEAGLAAQRGYAWLEANRHYGRALELWDRVDPATAEVPIDRAELLNRAADTAELAGDSAAAVELGRAAITAVDSLAEPARAGAMQERLRWYLWEAGDRAAAAAAVEEAERLIPATPPSPARSRV